MRRRYIDNIRWTTVVLVVFYHVIFLYSAIEPELGLGPFRPVQYQDAFPYIVYPWFMALLFVVSGISSRLYLESHTGKEYLGSRTRKLLVPSTLGLFVFQWIQGYVSMGISGGVFDGLPFFVRYLILIASGTGVLWFIQLCWVYSAALLLVRKAEKDRLYSLCGKFPTWALVLLVFPLWGASKILNAPMVIVYRVGFYGFCFFLGYFVFAHKELVDRLEKSLASPQRRRGLPVRTIPGHLLGKALRPSPGPGYLSVQCLRLERHSGRFRHGEAILGPGVPLRCLDALLELGTVCVPLPGHLRLRVLAGYLRGPYPLGMLPRRHRGRLCGGLYPVPNHKPHPGAALVRAGVFSSPSPGGRCRRSGG